MKNKTAFISGASRGIGKAIALRLAQEGANIVVAAKTAEPHPKLDGTIYSAAEEIEAVVAEVIAETGATSKADMGKVMKAAQAKTEGRADGKTLSQTIQSKLS